MAATGSLAAKRMEKMGKSSEKMSALEVASLGKRLASGEDQMTGLMMDPADPDWQTAVRRAKSGGPGSLFASKVNFTLAGTPFVGKVGYSVTGGVVPLFDGAAIDLNTADLQARDPKKTSGTDPVLGSPASYKNWVVGSGGLLVLAPVGADNVVPVVTEQVVVTEQGLSASAKKPVTFRSGAREIGAEEMTVSEQVAVLKGLHIKEDGEDRTDRYLDQAIVNGAGIGLIPAPERVQEPAGIQEAGPVQALENADQLLTALTETVAPEGVLRFGAAKEEAENPGEQRTGMGLIVDMNTKSVDLGYNGKPKTSEEEDEPVWTQVLNAIKEDASQRAKTLLLEVIETGKAEEFMKKFQEDAGAKWEQLKAVYDGFSDEELRSSWAVFPKAVKDYFRGELGEEDAEEYMKKLIPTGPLTEFLGLGEDEEKETDAKKDKWAEIPLAEIPLFPGVSFGVSLTPGYSLSTFILGGAHNLKNLWDSEGDGSAELEFSAGVRGSLSLKAEASLEAGIPLIIQGYGSLFAKASMEGGRAEPAGTTRMFGAAGGSAGIALAASGKLPVKRMKDGSIKQSGRAEASLEGGLVLKGSVGVDAGIRSKVLMWKKSLFEKTFAEWDLLSIGAVLKVSKAPVDGIFSGWDLDEASISVEEGFLPAFLKRNTAGRRYGLYKPEEISNTKYGNVQEDFQAVLRLLEDFKTVQGSGETLLISKEEGESGFSDTLQAMEDQLQTIQNSTVRVWVDAQNELEYMESALARRKESALLAKENESLAASASVHDARIAYMNQWRGETDGNVMDYYKAHESGPGGGFEKHMYQKALDSSRTYEGIVAYEREQYQKKTKKHFDRIAALEALMSGAAEEETVRKAYKKEMKGSQAQDSRARVLDTQDLLDYEYSRFVEVTKDERKRRTEAMAVIAGEDFVKAYADKYLGIGGAGKFEGRDVYWLGSPSLLLKYEKDRTQAQKGVEKKDLEMLGAADAAVEAAAMVPGEDLSGRLTDQLRRAMYGKDGQIPSLTELFGDGIYRTATLDDLIAVELEQRVWGEEGQALSGYLSGTPAKTAGAPVRGEMSGILGKGNVENALVRLGSWLDQAESDALIPHLTLEILLDYALARERKLKATKDREAQNQAAMAIRYLRRGQTKLEAVPEEEKAEVQAEYIAGYFRMYEDMEKQYRESLKSGDEMNLPLMMTALSEDPENLAYQALLKMKANGTPDPQALVSYLSLTGGKKEILQEIREHQQQKFAGTSPDILDVQRFYSAKIAENTQKAAKKDAVSHYGRYSRLRTLAEGGASYEEMLAEYEKMGAGNGYKEFLLNGVKAGKTGDHTITREDLIRLENNRVERAGEKHLKRIDRINEARDQGQDYEAAYGAYKAQVSQDDPGLWKTVKNSIGKQNRYERTMAKTAASSEELIAYERMRARETGQKHADRLRVLLDLPEDAENFMEAGLIQDPGVKEAKRTDYLEKAKRFKKMDQAGDLSFGDFKKKLREQPGDALKKEILTYEDSRKQEYEAKLEEIRNAEKEIRRMRDELKAMAETCGLLTHAVINIKNRPEAVWDELGRFGEAAGFIDAHKDAEAEAQRAAQVSGQAGDRASTALAQINELQARREEDTH